MLVALINQIFILSFIARVLILLSMPRRAVKKNTVQSLPAAPSSAATAVGVRDTWTPLNGEELSRLTCMVEQAQDLERSGINVELETKIGFLRHGTFVPGVCQGRFRFLLEWLLQSTNLSVSQWEETIVTHRGPVRELVSKKSCTVEVHEKKRIGDLVMLSNHPEGVAFKFSLSSEVPCNGYSVNDANGGANGANGVPAPTSVRLRQRKSFGIASATLPNNNEAFRVDFTLAWLGKSERAAKERQRHGSDTAREIEIEIVSKDYLLKRDAQHVAQSLYAKAASLFSSEMPTGSAFSMSTPS